MRHRHAGLAVSAAIAVAVLATGCADNVMTAPSRPSPTALNADRQNPTFDIDTFVVKEAAFTQPQGINSAGDVVGWYTDAAKHSHGFIRHAGVITTIDFEKADHTLADNTTLRGIGPDGEIVGTYRDNSEEGAASHGFKRTPDGVFIPVQYISNGTTYNVILQRILPDGTILGCRHLHDTMGSMKGIMIAGDRATEIDTVASMNNGATPDGHLVIGYYTTMDDNRTWAYTIENGTFTPFAVPRSTNTNAWDVNPRGDIVGVYTDGAGATQVTHGYVRIDGRFKTIDVDGASATRAFGINARGDVVGSYTKGGVTRGFIARRVR